MTELENGVRRDVLIAEHKSEYRSKGAQRGVIPRIDGYYTQNGILNMSMFDKYMTNMANIERDMQKYHELGADIPTELAGQPEELLNIMRKNEQERYDKFYDLIFEQIDDGPLRVEYYIQLEEYHQDYRDRLKREFELRGLQIETEHEHKENPDQIYADLARRQREDAELYAATKD